MLRSEKERLLSEQDQGAATDQPSPPASVEEPFTVPLSWIEAVIELQLEGPKYQDQQDPVPPPRELN